jgi:hypothetical protein
MDPASREITAFTNYSGLNKMLFWLNTLATFQRLLESDKRKVSGELG